MMSGTAVRTLKEASITESGLNPECLIEIRWKCHRKRPCRWCTPTETDRNEAGKRCFCRDCSQERPRAGLGSFPRSGDAQPEQTGQRVSGSRVVLQFERSALVRVREPNHFPESR